MQIHGLERPPFDENHRDPLAGYVAPPPAFVQDGTDNRLIPELREAVRNLSPIELLTAAAVEFLRPQPNHPAGYGEALADLAVTGRNHYAMMAATNPQPADLIARVEQALGPAPHRTPQEVSDATTAALRRAYEVAWMLRARYPRPSGPPELGGWVAVSGEEDAPHRPVNVSVTPYPQYDLTVDVPTRLGPAESVTTRLVIAHGDPPKPIIEEAAPFNCPPGDGTVQIPPSSQVLLYLHGMDSRLEEADDLTPHLLHQPALDKTDTGYTVIAMDLPTSGYATMVDVDHVSATSANWKDDAEQFAVLEFLRQFVLAFVDGLSTAHQEIPLDTRTGAVMGGSLGGNLTMLLGELDPDWLPSLVPWSPASTWDPVRGPGKDKAPHGVHDFLLKPANDALRAVWFKDAFDTAHWPAVPVGPSMWYRDDWPWKTEQIQADRFDRQEMYNNLFARWHWRLAFEQLCFSHHKPDDGPLCASIRTRTMFVVGAKDHYTGADIDTATLHCAQEMSCEGDFYRLADTGHSIHNERPELLGRKIIGFVPPLDTDTWGPWNSLGGAVTSNPVVKTNADSRLELFGLGSDGLVYHSTQNAPNAATWSPWAEITGGDDHSTFAAPLSVASNGDDSHLELFAVSLGHGLHHIFQERPSGPWQHHWSGGLGDNAAGAVVAATKPNGLLAVVMAYADGSLHIIGQNHPFAGPVGWWPNPNDLPGGFVVRGQPALALGTQNTLALVATAHDGGVHALFESAPDGDDWDAQWSDLDARFEGDPDVVVSHRTLYIAGCDAATAQLIVRTSPADHVWDEWVNLGGRLAPSARPAPFVSAQESLYMFARWSDGSVQYRRSAKSPRLQPQSPIPGWSEWVPIAAAPPGSDPFAALNADGTLEVFVRDDAGAIWSSRQQQ